ncbi:hypothetical protein PQR33_14935 [Paraburkholderia sediminicola]|uniref:hypothetical protein n=1 Tax=Paraburkholderia sediminicola TaxID=458836 RepID=UPI0038BA5D69
MREYAKVSPQFWIGGTGKKLRKAGAEAQVVGLYLLSSPHANMIGLYYAPVTYIAHDTGLTFEGVSKGLRSCIEAGFCQYDEASELVWVMEMAAYQIAPSLLSTDKRCAGVQNEYNSLPENPYLAGFFDKYHAAYHMTRRRADSAINPSPSEGAPMPLASQEQEQEQEQEQKQESQAPNPAGLALSGGADAQSHAAGDVEQVFAYWKEVMRKPRARLDDKRRNLIKRRLAEYGLDDVCTAIRGCSRSEFHMGKNDRDTAYNGLDLILRDASKIEMFIGYDTTPPRPGGPSNVIAGRNDAAIAGFLSEERSTAGGDPYVIDMEAA